MLRKFCTAFLAACCLAGTHIPAQAAPVTYYASLSGPAESPANASPGTGLATVTIDPVLHTLVIHVTFSGLVAGTTASHIHVINGPGDANTADTVGPIAAQTPTFIGFPLGVTAGSYDSPIFDSLLDSTFSAGWISASGGLLTGAESALFAGIMDGRAYLNIHTSAFPGGEVRGFLQLQAVPEPGTLALMSLALASLIMLRRRRVRLIASGRRVKALPSKSKRAHAS